MESAPDFNPFFFHGFLVLSNPEVRSICNVYGQKGLDAGWEVRLNVQRKTLCLLKNKRLK